MERPRPTAVHPNETSATTLDKAKHHFRAIPDLDAVVKAAELGNVAALLDMAKGGNYCERIFKEGPPPVCRTAQHVPGVYIYGGHGPVLGPIDALTDNVRSLLSSILSQQPVRLDFASRDARYGEGNGGEYYLLFRASRPVNLEASNATFDKIGILVKPGEPQPIQWFTPFLTSRTGLQWIQEQPDIAPYQVLIAPESVRGWTSVDTIIGPTLPPPHQCVENPKDVRCFP